MDPRLANFIRRNFLKFGVKIDRVDPERPDPWSAQSGFQSLYQEIAETTLVTIDRCFAIHQFAQATAPLPGVMAEIGVYRGGTARLIAKTVPEKRLYAFDTFDGMPEVSAAKDVHQQGDFADTSLEAVTAFLSDCANVSVNGGKFPDSGDVLAEEALSFVHIDVDIYESVRESLAFVYDRVVPSGVILIDDYDWKNCPGVRLAVEEFLQDKPETALVSARYQCAILKLAI